MGSLPTISPELGYVLLVLGLFLVPRVLQRFRLPGAVTSVAMGGVLGMGFHVLQRDPTVQWLGTLGIVALFLFAGLEVDFVELRRGARVVAQHVVLQAVLLAFAAIACAAGLGLRDREATLLALALFTPSTGFIFDALGAFGLDAEQRFWVKSKAVGSELVALVILFLTVQSTDARTLVTSTGALVMLVAVLPWVFRVFSTRILPHAPRSEFTFLVIVALLSAFLTRRLGVYYLVGAFVVGLTAVRMRSALPGLVSEKVIGAVELFASFFVPFYFLRAGLHLSVEDFTPRALVLGAIFLFSAVPVRVGMVVLHRRWVLHEPAKEAARVGLSLVPTLVFTMVIANILVDRYHVDRAIHGALIVFALGNTLLPGLLLRARIEFDASHDTIDPTERVAIDSEDDSAAEASQELSSGQEDPLAGTLTPIDEPAGLPLGRLIRGAQDAVFAWIVGREVVRDSLVAARLRLISPNAGRYWAAVVVSSALGSVGVLLDSVPLVVAAAIACPLVSPIGGLALGLASGSPLLVLRTLVRGATALIGSIAVAALVTRLVPYMVAPGLFRPHIPTLLDFAAAAACALVVVLSELRGGSASYVIAARAAVGHVVLVPACVAGFTMGTGGWSSFGVTMWALLANVATLVVVGLVVFLGFGMHHVDATRIETRELEGMSSSPLRTALLRPLQRMFASRWALATRVVVALAVLLLAAIPLQRALGVVAHEARIREAVQRAVAALPSRVLETRVEVRPSGVSVAVLQVGNARLARDAREALEHALGSIAGVQVDVVAVPDSSALAALEDQLLAARTPAVDPAETTREVARLVDESVRKRAGAQRTILDVSIRVAADGYQSDVAWVGPAATPGEQAALSEASSESVGQLVSVHVVAFSDAEVPFEPRDLAALARVFARAELAATIPGLVLCVTRPIEPVSPRTRRTRRTRLTQTNGEARPVDVALAGNPSVALLDGMRFAHRFGALRCGRAVSSAPEAPSGVSNADDVRATAPPIRVSETHAP